MEHKENEFYSFFATILVAFIIIVAVIAVKELTAI